MANNDFIHINWDGIDKFVGDISKMEEAFMDNLETEMNTYASLVEEGSRALAHRFGGDLEESILATKAKVMGSSVSSNVGSILKYALKRHESPYRMGVHDAYDNGVKFEGYYVDGRGRRTYQKPTWRGQKAGRKFMERAIVATEEDFKEGMDRALDKTLGGDTR